MTTMGESRKGARGLTKSLTNPTTKFKTLEQSFSPLRRKGTVMIMMIKMMMMMMMMTMMMMMVVVVVVVVVVAMMMMTLMMTPVFVTNCPIPEP